MFVLISMLASAFLAHYNAPKFYSELQAPAEGSKLNRFNFVVASGFLAAAVVMGSVMVGGFLTFGSASQGLILNSYATGDPLAFLARLGIGMSIIFSYPLNFVGLREGILSSLGKTEEGKKTSVHVALTLALMFIMNGASLFLKGTSARRPEPSAVVSGASDAHHPLVWRLSAAPWASDAHHPLL